LCELRPGFAHFVSAQPPKLEPPADQRPGNTIHLFQDHNMSSTKISAKSLAAALAAAPRDTVPAYGAWLMLSYALKQHPDDVQAALDRARGLSAVKVSNYLDCIDAIERAATV
jgi:hypothetical protein